MYIHTDIFSVQSPKKTGHPCGDAYEIYRDQDATVVALADGLGSGIKAHISATMCVSRIIGLIKGGVSVREAFNAVAETMDRVWGTGDPFSVFTVMKIMNNGNTVILSYEMPPPVLICPLYAHALKDRVYTRNKAIIHESTCTLSKDEGVLLMTDGITQAGIGHKFIHGWETEGVVRHLQSILQGNRIHGEEIATEIHETAKSFWPKDKGDDCSVLLALNRRGVVVNLMCGPPENKNRDEDYVKSFISSEGIKIVCGGSTSKMLARITGKNINITQTGSNITPPAYEIEGIELVCEGVITLNQAFHLLPEEIIEKDKKNPAAELAWFLKMADRINIWEGLALNTGEDLIEFKQQGLLSRNKILKSIKKRLVGQEKLIVNKMSI